MSLKMIRASFKCESISGHSVLLLFLCLLYFVLSCYYIRHFSQTHVCNPTCDMPLMMSVHVGV